MNNATDSLKESVKEGYGDMKDILRDQKNEAGKAMNEITSGVSQLAHIGKDLAEKTYTTGKEAIDQTCSSVVTQSKEIVEQTGEQAGKFMCNVKQYVEKEPLKSVLFGVAAGALLAIFAGRKSS
jgi:ElaB/YqjD/DUF883 family membrane-anchored ribosome-binding protein